MSSHGSLEDIVIRLSSPDANDRVKAAAELGEIGTPNEAPMLLKSAYEDEASTVRQIAIQAYAEIMKENALDELIKAAVSHPDEYVRIYAVMMLDKQEPSKISQTLKDLVNDSSSKLRATVVRTMIHTNLSQHSSLLYQKLTQEEDPLVIRNIIEALTLWRNEEAKEFIKNMFTTTQNSELKTISAFYLATYHDPEAIEFIDKGEIDSFIRIILDGKRYRGRKGLQEAIKYLQK